MAVPVFSVGNLTVGGTGKTPMVEWLARWLMARGRRPAILSRGYGAFSAGSPHGAENDEARLLREDLPGAMQVVDRDRVRGGLRAIAQGADCLLLDDGFQHLRLYRDVDIVLIDALDPFGGGHVLPAGFLRERASALRDADVMVITRAHAVEESCRLALRQRLLCHAPDVPIIESAHRPVSLESTSGCTSEPESLAGKRVYLFCAIGNPRAFLRDVQGLGATVVAAHFFEDHHRYLPRDCDALLSELRRANAEVALTTRKDAVKLSGMWPDDVPLCVLRTEFTIVSGMELLERVLRGGLMR